MALLSSLVLGVLGRVGEAPGAAELGGALARRTSAGDDAGGGGAASPEGVGGAAVGVSGSLRAV